MQHEELGIQFGKYQIFSKLAVGGMAEVFLAKQSGLGGYSRTIVLKCILPHLAEQPSFVTMFLDEARVACHLNHPNICQIYEVGQVDGVYYIAMEYIRGQDLRKLRNRFYEQPAPVVPQYMLAANIVMQAALSLHHAHKATDDVGTPLHIVHRDVSPTNLLLSYDGIVKLVDFGVAKASIQEHKTRAGMVKGKYRYMSPEQLAGDPVDHRSDIFSLGIVLYELSTNVSLFRRRTEVETIQAIHHDPIITPSTFDTQYPIGLENILMTALQRDPNHRYQSTDAMGHELHLFLRNQGSPVFDSHQLSIAMKKLFKEEEQFDRSGVSRAPLTQADIRRFGSQELTAIPQHSLSSPNTPTANPSQDLHSRGLHSHDSLVASQNDKTSPSLPNLARAQTSSKTSPLLWLPLLILVGLGLLAAGYFFSRWESTPIQKFSWQSTLKDVKKLIKERQYIEAATRLKALQQRPDVGPHQRQIKRLQRHILWGPKLHFVRQLLLDGETSAAKKRLIQLSVDFPEAWPIGALLQKLRQQKPRPETLKTRPEPAPTKATKAPPHHKKAHKRRRRRRRRRHRRRRYKSPKTTPKLSKKVALLKTEPQRPIPTITTGTLSVESSPKSRVSLDGKEIGSTPLIKKSLRVGTYALKLTAKGSQTLRRSVTILRAETTRLRLVLQPTPRAQKEPPPRTVKQPKEDGPTLPFRSVRAKRNKRLRIFISDRRGIIGNQLTQEHIKLARQIEREAHRLLGPKYPVKNITLAWQRHVQRYALKTRQSRITVYPRAIIYLIYKNLSRGRSKSRVAQLLVSYQRRRRFRKLKLP